MERPALPHDFGPLDSEDGNVNRWLLCECADTILLLRFLSLFLYVCLELVLNLNMSFIIMVDMNYFSNKQDKWLWVDEPKSVFIRWCIIIIRNDISNAVADTVFCLLVFEHVIWVKIMKELAM